MWQVDTADAPRLRFVPAAGVVEMPSSSSKTYFEGAAACIAMRSERGRSPAHATLESITEMVFEAFALSVAGTSASSLIADLAATFAAFADALAAAPTALAAFTTALAALAATF